MDKTANNLKRIAFLTSGGDAPGMNACIRAVVRACIAHDLEAVGVQWGFQGLLDRKFEEYSARSVSNILQRGGTILMASRCEDFKLPEQRAAAHINLRRAKVDALIGIGGEGTMRGLEELGQEHSFPVIGLPATIDNDVLGTDFSIGFDTAINTALEMVDRLRDTIAAYEKVMLVEVMGRHSGQIALYVGLGAGAEEVLIPETQMDIDTIVDHLKAGHKRGKSSQIIVVAEGNGLGGCFEIAKKLEGRLDIPVRISVLGHVQRGGSPTARDRLLAGKLGVGAVKALVAGESGVMVGELNYKIASTPLRKTYSEHKPISQNLLELLGILAR